MKAEEKMHGSVKRFGARYGRKLKLKFSHIEAEQRKLHKCPYCHKIAVKRLVAGIWECRKCDAKFSGKAYSIYNKVSSKDEEAEKAEIVITDSKAEEADNEAAEEA